ncbi:Protein of unknown function [Lactobacillus helveticus CIRM-BIA 951]|uniref:Uncharacterized protein n=2 Tax=Lactobacillus helveticus TaxID=1587 RepID=U6FB47_LACHE|nr:Protein of unknown function [Lactobacillus helveticus CIRM-BIA 951]CDI60250.1 Protein of unknown function [Lactobacillus helveticus CIRM-BIA 104]
MKISNDLLKETACVGERADRSQSVTPLPDNGSFCER